MAMDQNTLEDLWREKYSEGWQAIQNLINEHSEQGSPFAFWRAIYGFCCMFDPLRGVSPALAEIMPQQVLDELKRISCGIVDIAQTDKVYRGNDFNTEVARILKLTAHRIRTDKAARRDTKAKLRAKKLIRAGVRRNEDITHELMRNHKPPLEHQNLEICERQAAAAIAAAKKDEREQTRKWCVACEEYLMSKGL